MQSSRKFTKTETQESTKFRNAVKYKIKKTNIVKYKIH